MLRKRLGEAPKEIIKVKAPSIIKPKKAEIEKIGNYFAKPKAHRNFIKSGSTLLDLALGGGWCLGTAANIVGDKSTGKTLLAIEATANMAKQYPDAAIYYRESEAAFDKQYAAALGMPLDRIDFGKGRLETIEQMYSELDAIIQKAKEPTLYICDSLDAISDEEEKKREFGKKVYRTKKATDMSELFRRIMGGIAEKDIMFLIVSQTRQNMNGMFETRTRTGGMALDFYVVHALYLTYIGQVTKDRKKLKRTVGIKVKAQVKKNKISQPFRNAEFKIMFGYGIDDLESMFRFLKETSTKTEFDIKDFNDMGDKEFRTNYRALSKIVRKRWYEVEDSFLPKRRKYA